MIKEVFVGKDLCGYLKSCKKVIDVLNEREIKASLFFPQRGCAPSNPASTTLLEKALTENASLARFSRQNSRLFKARKQNKDFAQDLLKKGHSVGLHAVHTKDFKDF